jgi:hypothetical protein
MASQAEIDTAAAKAKQGGGQAAKDTAAAKAKQNNNNQAAKDTAKAKSRQNGGDGGTAADFSAREAAAGLNLSGNNTTSGRGEIGPTFSQREANAGLTLAGNDTTAGRDDFYSKPSKPKSPWASFDSQEMKAGSDMAFRGDVPSGGGGLAGIEIIWADQNIEFIEAADLTDTYNDEAYWSLVLTVSSGSFDKTIAYDATADIFTTTGTAPNEVQTKYRMRLITQYTNGDGDNVSTGISAYGQYREVTLCVNGSPRQSLIKVT